MFPHFLQIPQITNMNIWKQERQGPCHQRAGSQGGLSVWETKWLMDVELFLEGQAWWEADSPNCLVMLHEMFQHVSEQWWKEVECMVYQGYLHRLPKLDPEVDISAIQLVGPQTSKKEIESLYYELYKLWRLLGSPSREPELMAEVVSPLEDCQGQEWREAPQATGEPDSADVWSQGREPPKEGVMPSGKEVLPKWEKPIIGLWLWQLP